MTLTDDLDIGTKKGSYHKETHVNYESSITYHSKVGANVKGLFFFSQTNGQADRQTN